MHYRFALLIGMSLLASPAFAEGNHDNKQARQDGASQNQIDTLRERIDNRTTQRDFFLGKGLTDQADKIQKNINKMNQKIDSLLDQCPSCG